MNAVEAALPEFKTVVAQYATRDVYNMDETGKILVPETFCGNFFKLICRTCIFFSMTPDNTFAQKEVEGCKTENLNIWSFSIFPAIF